MKALSLPIVMLALFCQAPPAARAQPGQAQQTATELVARSGLSEQLKSYPKQIDQQIAQARGSLPGPLLAAMRDAAAANFDYRVLQQDMAQTLAGTMRQSDMREAIAWLLSGTGRRVTRAEIDASASLSPDALRDYLATSKRQPQSAGRRKLLSELIQSTHAVEMAANEAEALALAVAIGMDDAQPVQRRLGLANLRKRLRELMPPEQVRASLAAQIPLYFSYTYRRVSDKDLAEYLQFNRSVLGRHYNKAVAAALVSALTRAGVRMGAALDGQLRGKQI